MGLKRSLLIELERETQSTRRILERLTDEHLDWRPHEKSMSVKDLAYHIVGLHNWVATVIPMTVFDFKTDFNPKPVSSIAELRQMLDEGYALNKAAIENATDESWGEDWTMQAGPEYVIAKMPRAGAMRYVVNNHLIHHRGQLTVYLRMLDIPVPGLYGPSADENQG
ncbi:DinB family protein [Sphingobacterium psychroaquaticum]|uniref:Uncharacterized damage-inducible protein DinB (Forms a four-helix bundle) n=1 Tax=Sphingobacterium psychroaquaticum TaxID=561061 RepID=A0A1X7KNC6_9SPHI|nr:DinB family protein [Sphingobacterium psychroaquaticum]QBQ40460.1 damage-inducible protein DinB [Sphingobacterium psychroaquaticum]SMG42218.1 Uncharacterized damage-inducible protein DinB (forms a four-helix bundle) [Sphingobacterium psychroaquaticum]